MSLHLRISARFFDPAGTTPMKSTKDSGLSTQYSPTRRDLLESVGHGFGTLALAALLGRDGCAEPPSNSSSGGVLRTLHHPPKAKRVVQLFMAGAASHIDLFDFKPELIKRHGLPSDFGEPV